MGRSYFISLWITLVIAGTYWYQSGAAVCPAPLSYRLGNIDPSFSITPDEAKLHISNAEAVWEKKANRELFVYDEKSDFTIDFIFDERQATADLEEKKRQELDKQSQQNETVIATVEKAQREYQALSQTFNSRTSKYEADLSSYNAEVNKYNDRGGAPTEVYAELEKKRQKLNAEADNLSKMADDLNQLAKEINQLGEKGNKLVDSYNREVNQYNSEFGVEREFTQGDYQSTGQIHIYKFSNTNELERVLVHEFGHALGINHVDGNSSIMYYLMEDTSSKPLLSTEDVLAYYDTCGVTESFGQEVRRVIRGFLAKF